MNRQKQIVLIMLFAAWSLSVSATVKLKWQGNSAHIEVNGKPMLIFGGELSNSAATSIADIDSVIPRMARLGLNTVLVPAQWDLIEPVEGKFDFSLIDETIQQARKHDMRVVFLWFGAWKNSMSCYAPMWFKQDVKRFPRAETAAGKPLEIASAFSENVFQADCRAFCRLMQHIADVDATQNTVIMIQVENEIGMLEAARDHAPAAEKMWKKQLKEGLFSDDIYGEERFMALHYAKYVERMAVAGRKIHDIPMYVNAAMNSRGRKPGEYPSAGPLAHLADIWQTAAPHIDILAPDIYDTGFKQWASQYDLTDEMGDFCTKTQNDKKEKAKFSRTKGKTSNLKPQTSNPLFVPESRCCNNSGVRALYSFGEHQAVGFCPFAIDQASSADENSISSTYKMLKQLEPLLMKYRGKGAMRGVLMDKNDRETILTDGKDVVLTCRHYFTLPWDPRATDGSEWPEGGAIIVRLSPKEYLIAGNGVVIEFKTTTEKQQEEQKKLGEDGFLEAGNTTDAAAKSSKQFSGKRLGIGYVDEVKVDENGNLQYVRRENGDQSHQGRHARISVGENKILRVKLYEY